MSELGFVDHWMQRRREEFEGRYHPLGEARWEWEAGFRQGVERCKGVALEG